MKHKNAAICLALSCIFCLNSVVEATPNNTNNKSVFAGASAVLSSYLSMTEGLSLDDIEGDFKLFSIGSGEEGGLYIEGNGEYIDTDAADEAEGDEAEGDEAVSETADAEAVADDAADEGEAADEVTDDGTIYGYTNLGIANVENYLNVRKGPSTDDELVGKLPVGAGCEILEELDGWYKIESANVTGYVCADFLLTGEDARIMAEDYVRTVATVTTEALRVRDEPNTECKIDVLVPEGEELIVIEDMGDWIKIDMDDYEAYVSAEYVEIGPKLPHGSTIKELNYGKGISDTRVDLVQYALQFVGNRYVWGGTSLTNGVDCSGFTMKILGKYGVSLPHSSRSQSGMGTKVTGSTIQPGDLVFYGSGSGVNHVAIYIGNGQIVHASNKRDGIKISNMYYRTPITMRSFL